MLPVVSDARKAMSGVEEVFVPAVGEALEEVVLLEWLKQPGATIVAGEPIAVIETDKTTLELSSRGDGQLGRHRFEPNATIAVGAVIAYVLGDGESEPEA